ncbi:MAG: hypothetical protein GPJ54_16665 [Candidatus Heimdallarchaeota archaeon]|nr:hypothetical protein [Candidatus Heimdallarchaeota archaeon]
MNGFQDLSINDQILTIVAFLYIYPLIKLIQSYRLTKSKDYLIMIGIFAPLTFNFITAPVLDDFPIFMLIGLFNALIVITCGCLHGLMVRYTELSKRVKWSFIIFYIALNLFALIWVIFLVDGDYSSSFLFVVEPYRGFAGICWLIGYWRPNLISESKEINRVVNLWRILGIVVILTGFGSTLLLIVGSDFFGSYNSFMSVWQNVLLIMLAFYISLWHPELLFISKAQIVRACELYKMVHIDEDHRQFNTLGLMKIKEYIETIPMEVFDPECTESIKINVTGQ